LNRRLLRLGAIIGAATVSTLAVAPVFAAAPVSQASAQSIKLSLAGTPAVSQLTTATNTGGSENVVDDNTLPSLAGLIPGNNALSLGVGVQKAQANADGTSFACAGVAGTGGGLVTVGKSSCNINGKPLTLNLGSLNLDLTDLIGGQGAITEALNGALGPVVQQLGGALDGILSQLTGALNTTPLGAIGISGGLSAVEATCTADPDAAHGAAEILDTSGNHTIPISVTLPGVAQPVTLANLDVDVPATPGGTDVLVHLDTITQALINAVTTEVGTVIQGQLAGLADALKLILQPIQDTIITAVVNALKPALQAISDNILKVVVNDVTPGDGGRSVSVNTLKIDVLGGAAQFIGSSLISGTIGHVTCGPNAGRVVTPPTTTPTGGNPSSPHVPTVVDSGVAGHGDNTARTILAATAALMLLAGTAGLIGYRRNLLNK
jgi:hypothetical protein